jgi:squalene-associated FAD-dependent desaturase
LNAPKRVAVIGAGWAGLAAAVRATELGHRVVLFDMAASLGGRARSVAHGLETLDNGQHILIGAYRRTLALMQAVGVSADAALLRQPLTLRYPDGRGLQMPAAPAWLGFGWAVMRCQGWSNADRWSLLREGAGWARSGFVCDANTNVAQLCGRLTPAVRTLLIEPLCVAALNTPAQQASGQVFLRVLKDALFSGAGSADLLLPRQPLGRLLPEPAGHWLRHAGAEVRCGRRVQSLQIQGKGAAQRWRVDGEEFDAVVLACSANEAARLAQDLAALWAAKARSLQYEPIITALVQSAGVQLPCPMLALEESENAPAQFVFDHGQLGGPKGRLAFVISGARTWVERGLQATGQAVLHQAAVCFGQGPPGAAGFELTHISAEKRATFRCLPALCRPPMHVCSGLDDITAPMLAAGDYVEGPYPATLEGAVRSGEAAAAALKTWFSGAKKALPEVPQ